MQYFTNKACGTSMKLLVLKHLVKKKIKHGIFQTSGNSTTCIEF